MSGNGSTERPASRAMDEAIELSIQGRSPYPERAFFVDVEGSHLSEMMARATDDGQAIVLVSADGTARVLRLERVIQVAAA
jgi:hypothetical protein